MIRLDRLSGNTQGAIWMLVSVAGATVMTVAIRVLAPEVHTAMLAFLRSVIGLVFVIPFLMRRRDSVKRIRFTSPMAHFIRGMFLVYAINAGFYGVWHLPLATATILFFTAPIFATLLAQIVLGEPVGPRRWSAIAAGFLGALIVLRPGFGEINLAMLAALSSSLSFAIALTIGTRISAKDGPDSVFVSSNSVIALGTLPPALFFWYLPDQLWVWVGIGVLVISSVVRTYADIYAYAKGEAGFVAPFNYLRLLTVGGIGYLWFDEVITWPTVLGGAVIIGSTLYISLREAKLNRARSVPKPP